VQFSRKGVYVAELPTLQYAGSDGFDILLPHLGVHLSLKGIVKWDGKASLRAQLVSANEPQARLQLILAERTMEKIAFYSECNEQKSRSSRDRFSG
jgi:hypothetical protein